MPDDGHGRRFPEGVLSLRGIVDVTECGARGDGLTDDTRAVQAALDRGGITFFPPGEYACSTLVMRLGSRLMGANSGTYTYSRGEYSDDYGNGLASRIVRRAGTNAPLIAGPVGAKRVIIEDLQLDGNNQHQRANRPHVVALEDSPETEDTQWVISRCYIHGRSDPRDTDWGSAASNVYIGARRQACRVLHTVSNYANHHGLEINGADAVVDACITGDNGAHGMVVGAWMTTITGCAIYNNTHGIYVADTGSGSPKRILISANGIDRNRQHGLLLDIGSTSGAAGVSIVGNAFTTNGTADGDTWAHVCVRSTTGHVALGGNVFSVTEPGYDKRTTVAVLLGAGASALDMGNVYEGGSVNGFTNAPQSLYTTTRQG